MVTVSGLFLLLKNTPSSENQLTGRVEGGAASGWINDVQATVGGGNDSSPTMVSIGDSVFVAFSRFDVGSGYQKITVIESTDGGVVWFQIGDFSPGPHDCKHPVMTVYNGELYVAFQYDLSVSDHDIYCYRSSPGAIGPWTAYRVRSDTNDDYRPTIDAVTIQNYAGVYVAFENRSGGTEGTDLLISKSLGGAFSDPSIFVGGSDAGEYTMADMSVYDDQINPVIFVAFMILTGSQHDIYFVRSLNGGGTWSSLYQVTSSLNDEYAPSISAGYFFVIISYIMWDGDPDLYAVTWNGAYFGTPYPLSSTPDIEGSPIAYNLLDNFYVVYPRGSTNTSGHLYMQSASGSVNPTWSYPSMLSDSAAAADVGYRPGLTLCDRPDSNLYFAAAWGDYRSGTGDSDLLYSTEGCRYTVRTDPPGMTFLVDDVAYSSEQTFNWPAGFQHTLNAPANAIPFFCLDDGTNQWFTATISPYASTSDVTPGMTAYYTAIPEFSHLVIPVMGMIGIVLLSWVRSRKR